MKRYINIGLIIVSLFWWTQTAFAQDTIPLNTNQSFEATYQPGYNYSWWYVDNANDTTYFSSNSNKTEEYYWGTEGKYELFAQAISENNCLSEIISKSFVVIYYSEDSGNIAGRDITIASCETYTLGGVIANEENYNFFWEPAENLDDPTNSTPVFTPGISTVFTLTATNKNNGNSIVDSVVITVSEIIADAGEDVYMDQNSSVLLDGSESFGEGITYLWTTISGNIENGENTVNPAVSGFGVYYLEVTDIYACVTTDSVAIEEITNEPGHLLIARDDYDTTSYSTEVKIPVLDNDFDFENDIYSLSLSISEIPYNGEVYVDFSDFTIHYIPNDGFNGSDVFKYRVCDATNNCAVANVSVLVAEYEFLIPDAFSPNGDNINDYFEIIGIEKYEGNSLMIFNRWGNKVYETMNYGISTTPQFWDGKSNTGFLMSDKDLSTGTYYYVLKLGNGEKPIAGSIYLDR